MAIRKISWKKLMLKFPVFQENLHRKFMDHYDRQIRQPLTRKRESEISHIQKKKHFEKKLIVLDHKDSNNINKWFYQKRVELYQGKKAINEEEAQNGSQRTFH